MTEIELKDTKKTTIQLISNASKVLLCTDQKTPNFLCDEILINHFYKNLTSKNLERRIKGINYIGKYLEILERKENPSYRQYLFFYII